MKTLVNYQVVFNKYIKFVLAGSFLLIVVLSQLTNYKSIFQYNSIENTNSNVVTVADEAHMFELVNGANIADISISEVNGIVKIETNVETSGNIETTIELENWMLETTPWTLESPNEEVVDLASWMLTTEPFLAIEETEIINLEDWMIDTIAWNLPEDFPLITEHIDAINMENWMIREDAWTDSNGFGGSEIMGENLLVTNNQL